MLIMAPGESWSYWTSYVFDAHRVGGVVYISNQSLRSTIYRFSHGRISEGLLVLLVLSIGIAGLTTAVWAYRKSSPLLGILLCAVTGLLVSPITWAHHLVWVVPIILWLALAHDRPAFGRVWAALVTVWYWYGAIWRIPHGSGVELHDTLAQMLVGNSYTISMLLFVAGMILMLALRHHQGSDDRNVLTGLDRTHPAWPRAPNSRRGRSNGQHRPVFRRYRPHPPHSPYVERQCVTCCGRGSRHSSGRKVRPVA